MRKSEKQKGDNRKKNDRPSIPIELPIPRKKKKRKKKNTFIRDERSFADYCILPREE